MVQLYRVDYTVKTETVAAQHNFAIHVDVVLGLMMVETIVLTGTAQYEVEEILSVTLMKE